MMCLDSPEEILIQGQYGHDFGNLLVIDVEKCYEKEKNCKTDEEIDVFIKENQIIMPVNTVEY